MTYTQIMIDTLEKIEVKGSQNMGYLLGVINALKAIREAEEKQEAEKKDGGDELNG